MVKQSRVELEFSAANALKLQTKSLSLQSITTISQEEEKNVQETIDATKINPLFEFIYSHLEGMPLSALNCQFRFVLTVSD